VRSGEIKIRSTEGPQFDCYLATPESQQAIPAIVIASAILGVNEDIRGIADDFASRGYMAAAPDLFWRTIAGPLVRGDPRAAARGEPRLEQLKSGERDLIDVLAMLRKQPLFNGRAAVMGLCYGGPYAIVAPNRLGYDAAIACHGSRMLDFVSELERVRQPVSIFWGDQDHAAPADKATIAASNAPRNRIRTIAFDISSSSERAGGRKSVMRATATPSLILRRTFNVIDDDTFHRNFCGFQLQPKLLLQRREDRRSRGHWRRSIVALPTGSIRRLRRPIQGEIVFADQPRLVSHRRSHSAR